MFTEKRKKFAIISVLGTLLFCVFGVSVFALVSSSVDEDLRSTPTLPPQFVFGTFTPEVSPPKCGGPEQMYILLVGSDTRGTNYTAGLADSIRVVRVDFVEPGVKLLAFQRDMYVEIPEISDHYGITHGKLNQAYLYGNPGYGYYDGEGQGPGLLSLTLDKNFGAKTDHFAAINLQTFIKIVDALGGIDINLPYVVDGRAKGSKDNSKYFPSGEQHLDGYRTMLLARMRPQGDIKRTQTQDLILKALVKQVFQPETILKLPDLIDAFKGSMQTDLGPAEIAQLLCLTAFIDTEDIVTTGFPEGLFKGTRIQDPVLGNTAILEVDNAIIRDYVGKFYEGVWP